MDAATSLTSSERLVALFFSGIETEYRMRIQVHIRISLRFNIYILSRNISLGVTSIEGVQTVTLRQRGQCGRKTSGLPIDWSFPDAELRGDLVDITVSPDYCNKTDQIMNMNHISCSGGLDDY